MTEEILPFDPFKEWENCVFQPLPTVDELALPAVSLATVLAERRSEYDYLPEPLSWTGLATLLYFGYGIREWRSAYGHKRFPMRRVASSGGLQSIDLYVIANRVESLSNGVYYYHPARHGLYTLSEGRFQHRLTLACEQDFMAQAPAVLILVANLPRLSWKYGPTAWQSAHQDAGILVHNLYLVGTALGLTTSAVSGFDPAQLGDLLELDTQHEFAVLLFPTGHLPRL